MGNITLWFRNWQKKDSGKEHFFCLIIHHFVYYLFIIRFSKTYIFYWYKITLVLNNYRKCLYVLKIIGVFKLPVTYLNCKVSTSLETVASLIPHI